MKYIVKVLQQNTHSEHGLSTFAQELANALNRGFQIESHTTTMVGELYANDGITQTVILVKYSSEQTSFERREIDPLIDISER